MVSKSNISSVIKLIADGKDHDLFELNQSYRLSYTQAKEVVESLSEIGVLELTGHSFKLRNQITKEQLVYLYRTTCYRSLHLECDVIDEYKSKALSINALVMPNFERLDENLLVDES